jgi:hypothetical protein
MFYTKHCNSLLTDKSLRPAISLLRLLAIVTAVLVFALSPVKAQEEATGQTSEAKTSPTIPARTRPVRTDSPRDTLTTFLRLRDSLETALLNYRAERSSGEQPAEKPDEQEVNGGRRTEPKTLHTFLIQGLTLQVKYQPWNSWDRIPIY